MTREQKPILIGGAWPYANGPLHIGQIAALLPGDVLARYFRQQGHPVLYVSGSDCHGTPIAIRARQEKKDPATIANSYHQSFCDVFNRLGFSYDQYSRTDRPEHIQLVQSFFVKLLHHGYLEKRTVSQVYCPECQRFLPDRYVNGSCPHCGQRARGDQCDACTALLSPEELQSPACDLCGCATMQKKSSHFYLRLSAMQPLLSELLAQAADDFRPNARQETARYLRQGLQDRAITRDLDWGVPLPLPEYPDKCVYVWVDALLGYRSASQIWSRRTQNDDRPFWSESAQAWFVHGKDNIVFHTLFLPALLYGADPSLKRPDHIVSSEYLTLEGQKISTSRNWAVWASELLDICPADGIRYYLLANNPEKRDADFSFSAFEAAYHGELLGAFGNLVHRTFRFVSQYRDRCTPNEACDVSVREQIEETYKTCAELLEKAEIKKALACTFLLVRSVNRYFDQEQPWRTRHDDPDACDRTLATCLHAIVNLSQLLLPYLPFSCNRIRMELSLEEPASWAYRDCPCGRIINSEGPLYPRLHNWPAAWPAPETAHK